MIIYLMAYFPLPIWWKIGFAHYSVTKRAKALDKAVFGFFIPVCAVVIPFAYPLEQWFHRKFRFLSFRFYKGDGSTETYWFPVAIPALLLMSLYWLFCFWAAGKVFGFDGIAAARDLVEWLGLFFQVIYQWIKKAFQFIA